MGQSLSSLSSSSGTRLGFDSSSPVIGFRDYSDQERHLLRLLRARAAGAPDPPLANSNDFDSAQQDQDNDPAAPTSPSAAPAIDALSPRDLPAPLSTLLLHHSFAANDLVPIDTVVAILRQYLVAIPSLPPSPATLRHRDAPLVTSASIRHVSATDEALLIMTSMDDDLSSSLSSSLSEASLASSNNPPQRIQQQQLQRSSRGSAGRAAVSPLPHPSLVRGHPSPHLSSKLSLGIGINADDSMSPSLFSLTLPDVLPLRMSDLDSQINVGLCSKGLVQLTPWIAHVKNATVLQLCCNSLSTLPPHIAHLQHLTVLSVAKNLLTWLPLELGHLTQLVELDVSHNRLTDLPASLGHLRKLHILRVDHNRITKLPRALGRLANLVSLDVSDNPLTTLPAELARLKHLRKLRTRNCPLTQLASHSPMALGTPDPPSRVPTLRELAARKLVATNATLDLAHLPRDLAAYLVSYDNCAFCSGPMFDHRVVRSRKFMKNDHVLPLEFELCSSHWSTERERIKALFSTPTSSTTRDAAEAAWREARRVFFAKPAAQSAVATAASSPAMQPARTGSPKPPSLFGFASSPVLSPVAGPALVPPTPRSRTPSMPWISLSRSRKHTAASNTPDLPTSPSLGSLLSPEFAHASTPTLAPSTPTLVAGYLAAADYYTPAPHAQEVEAHMADVFDLVSTTSSGALLPMAGPITALAAIRRMPLLPPVPARYPPPHPPPATSTSTAHAPNTPTMRSSLSLPASPRLNKRSMSVPQLPRSVTTSALGFITRSRTPTPAPSLPMVDEAAAQDLMVPPRVPSGAGWRDDDAGEIEIEIEVAPAPALVQQHATAGAAAFPDLAARTSVTPPASVYGSDVGVAAEQEEEAEAETDSSFKSMASHRSSRLGGWVARVSRLGGRWGSRRASASGASAAGAAAGDEVEGVERAPSLMAAQAE